MANLRIINYKAIDSKTIAFLFNDNLDSIINGNNILITALSYGVPDPTVISLDIEGKQLTITTTPLTPFAIYIVKLYSSLGNPFKSINGNLLFEDGKTNAPLITGVADPDNNMLDNLKLYFAKTPYATALDGPSVINSYLNSISDVLYDAQNAINQVKNENYVSVEVTDESLVRGAGPYDRLQNEGAYEVLRVGPYTSDVIFNGSIFLNPFPKEPTTLQTKFVYSEQLVQANDNSPGTFNGIICNLQNNNITIITQITVVSGLTTVIYDISAYGYQINNARYDSNASTYVLLNDNQFRFSDKALKRGFIPPSPGDYVIVDYQYKDLGVWVEPTSVAVNEINYAIREVCPPIITAFSLQHNNIVNSQGAVVSLGGVIFYDPKAMPPYSQPHAAFINEVPFAANSFPSSVGQYSIDYANGKVYVYGADNTKQNIGTGIFPPVCSYYYEQQYTNTLDFTYDPALLEISSNSLRNLIGVNAIITFNYSQNYVPNVDYVANVHNEVLAERIENRLLTLTSIEPANKPLTNVFRIFNETTGEIYRINRFSDAKIEFNYSKPPTILSNSQEKTNFLQITDEILIKNTEIINAHSLIVWTIDLNNDNIISATNDCIGSSINTSVTFSNNIVFQDELYYDRTLTVSININKLSAIGIYSIDYDNGIVYVAVNPLQVPDIGSISYKNKYILTNRPHILTVNNVYTLIDQNSDPYTFNYNSFTDTTVDLKSYDISDNKYITIDPPTPIFVLSNFINLPRNAKSLRGVYETTNINTSTSPINFAVGSIVDFSVATLIPVNIINTSVVLGGLTINVPDVLANSNFLMNSVVYVKRISDGYELYNTALSNGSFSGAVITLPTDTLAVPTDAVSISVDINLADISSVIVDINFGGLFIDYNSLYDEIIISYEYGDNVLDFRQSSSVPEGTAYYVSYKYGALRDALFSNFGSIINIEDFKNFNVDFERENYRDALSACLQNFPKGPTKTAISEIARIISHVTPVITEAMFEEWVLGLSYLYDGGLIVNGSSLLPSIWDYGIYFQNLTDDLEIPFSNHIKLDKGTTEFWVTPDWNGLDNDAILNIKITKDGVNLDGYDIWIGLDGYNPDLLLDGSFYLSKFDTPSPEGIPYLYSPSSSDGYGCYIYYDITDKHWKFIIKDIPTHTYWAYIKTNGEFYDSQIINIPVNINNYLRSSNKSLTFNFKLDPIYTYTEILVDGYMENPGISAWSDGGGATLSKQTGTPHSGTQCLRVSGPAAASASQFIITIGQTYRVTGWTRGDGSHGYPYLAGFNTQFIGTTSNSWQYFDFTDVANDTAITLFQSGNTGYSEWDDMFVDLVTANDGYQIGEISFMSDVDRYLLDYGNSLNENRISIYKDGKGYLNFKVFSKKDRFGNAHTYQISNDISNWNSGDNHHIAFSSRIASKDKKDELHLFIDGKEVPNILKYGGSPAGALTDRFRTVVPEIVLGTVIRPSITANDLIITAGSYNVVSPSIDFASILGVGSIGDIIYIEEIRFATSYIISPIIMGQDAHTLVLSSPMPYNLTNAKFTINKWTAPVTTELMYESNLYVSRYYYDSIADGYFEEELPGLRATIPAYSISVDGYGQPEIVIRGGTDVGDQIFIRTLGLNHRRFRDRVYVWGNNSNIINLNFPSPINLDLAKIFAVNRSKYVLNAGIRSDGYTGSEIDTIIGNIVITQGILPDTQPSDGYSGRTLTVTVSGDNIDYSVLPVGVTIYGTTFSGLTSELLVFTENGSQDSTEYFKTISSIDAFADTLDVSKATAAFEIKEKYQITVAENDGYAPIIRYSYQENASGDLDGYAGNIITSNNISFFQSQIGNTLVLTNPSGAAGSYIITDVNDYHTIVVSPSLPITFYGGSGSIYNVSIARSGFANGKFTFEYAGITPTNYNIHQGFYDFDYAINLEIPFDIEANSLIIGNNFNRTANANAIIEELRSLDYQSVDTRTGETLPSMGRSITTDYLISKPFDPDSHTTLLVHMDKLPPTNDAIPYSRFADKYFQFDSSLNNNFNEALYIGQKPLIIDNSNILHGNAGTIEFWISPDFDSRNDPNYRYMFDTSSAIIEETVSLTKGVVQLSKPAIRVYSIQLVSDTSISGMNYALGGSLLSDRITYNIGQPLPFYQTPVRITYSPFGIYGNRISIYKDSTSTCKFEIISGIKAYEVATPIFWTKDTWHRIMATWDFTKPRLGEMHLFIDGEEKVIVSSGSFLSGSGFISGGVSTNTAIGLNVSIKDQFQTLYIGSNFLGGNLMPCKIDNIKISRVKKNPVYILGQAFDNDYSSNISAVLPVVKDLYTTYLSDFDNNSSKIEDFSILKNNTTGAFDFTIQIIDSFDILDDNIRVKQILESLIKVLKPANTRAFIEYVK